MLHQELTEDLKKIILPFLQEQGFQLVELNFIRLAARPILQLLIDRKNGGITIQDCARLNTVLSSILDGGGLIEAGYILEVSSPGLDRPLKERSDFLRCINKKARFFLFEPINGKIELEGLISRVDDDAVYIDTSTGIIEIPLASINKAKEVI